MNGQRILCLGGGEGWHARELQRASAEHACILRFATYESLAAGLQENHLNLVCEAGAIDEFDAVITRTMPAGSLEQITFRLSTLHAIQRRIETASLSGGKTGPADSIDRCRQPRRPIALINPPRSLEIAIDKFATLEFVASLGYSVPDTITAQSRDDAISAFDQLGGDCVVKPIFGGEGRGVMRLRHRELAWTTFSTLEQLGAVAYLQRFIPPGGRDQRLLVIGSEVIGIRRTNRDDFRANTASGGICQAFEPSQHERSMALHICHSIGLKFGAVDMIVDASSTDHSTSRSYVIEVNAIPGWKGAQGVTPIDIADRIIRLALHRQSEFQPAED